jgi:hypothetical protein
MQKGSSCLPWYILISLCLKIWHEGTKIISVCQPMKVFIKPFSKETTVNGTGYLCDSVGRIQGTRRYLKAGFRSSWSCQHQLMSLIFALVLRGLGAHACVCFSHSMFYFIAHLASRTQAPWLWLWHCVSGLQLALSG